MTNIEFLHVLERSFESFLDSGTSRSNQKLKPLHGAIAQDIATRLGNDFEVKSLGFNQGHEETIPGRYIDKKVDITIMANGVAVGGIAVKFVMQNYAQNANNYFENMLGETANIRAAQCPYFQIFIIPYKIPYYDRNGLFKRWETFGAARIQKYLKLDADDPNVSFHSPDKLLLYILQLPEVGDVENKSEYVTKCKCEIDNRNGSDYLQAINEGSFDRSVILNDYEKFIDKVYHKIMAS